MHSDSRFYLRSLPFVGAILGFLLTLYFFPDVISSITQYIVNTDPEEDFSSYGWWLYALIAPCCIAGLSRLDDHWLFILTLALFPPVLALSYWLWEWLAWVLFGILFAWILMALKDVGASFFVLVIAIILYAICRVFGCFGNGELLVIGDVLFVTILGGYMLVISMIDVFAYDDKFTPSGITLLYVLVLCISLLGLSSVDKPTTTKKVKQTTTVSKTIYYCTATSGVNVRYTPASNSTIVGKLKHGQAVEVLEKGTSFTKISYNHSKGETAWVSTKYLSPTKPSTTTATEKKKTTNNNSSTTTSAQTSKTSSSSSSTSTTSTILLVDSKTSLNCTLSSHSGQRIFTVSTGKSDYQIASKPSWCTILRKSKGQFEIKYEDNPNNTERTGSIQVKAGETTVPIVLTQRAGTGYSSSNTTSTKSSSATTSSSSSSYSGTTTAPTKGMHHDYEWVDLGLSVKWATSNMNGHYRFGEKNPRPTRGNNADRYEGATYSLSNDVARANWGGKWRLPTKSEFEELINKCTWTQTTQGGEKGFKVTGPNGSSIFLPAAGTRQESSNNLTRRGEVGYYWSSTHYGGGRVWILNIYCDGLGGSQKMVGAYGSFGNCIRPVLP